MINTSSIILINLYQKYISPYKGYCCAYGVHHNDLSCSQFAKVTIQDIGLLKAISKILYRFKQCKDSNDYLQNEYENNQKNKDVKLGKGEQCGQCSCDVLNVSACFHNN